MGRPRCSISGRKRSSRITALASALLLSQRVVADCECGYSAKVSSSTSEKTQQRYVFTDLIETNFANISDVSKNTDWVRQAFNTTASAARGTYGQMFAVDNVETQDKANGDGLQITVRSDVVDGRLSGGEIDTARLDILHGTFRSSVRLTDVSGTVSAFFWYFNDTQEIDMEFLSKDFHTENSSYPVNLVLQSRESEEAGYNAIGTRNYQVAYLPFNPTTDFHEYRMDFTPRSVAFYADGDVLAVMDSPDGVPTSAGHLALSQWSNGNPSWSGGPPATDAVMNVKYVKAYFNSSKDARRESYAARCTEPTAAGAVCAIPAVTPGNNTAAGFFFTGEKNMTDNQTVSSDNGVSGSEENGGTSRGARSQDLWLLWALAAAGWMLGL
ncbi:hypothetical protein VPNG_00567 [Cytospora leucostoma]|uniref:GH16 domain-containing protein n=1 Tax=Cytospora leucostoma TaxID=1230097 RepID=A0A423XLZ0_9PEZI|nr:hypothetical protein VPNG_00567 [Cytospora leucostoma]